VLIKQYDVSSLEIHPNPDPASDMIVKVLPEMSISENIWLGREPFRNKTLHLIDWKEMHKRTREFLEELYLDIDPNKTLSKKGGGNN
jgi:ABC-type sugar transport system ATPase subunit